MRGRSRTCERARAWISAELDGELSDFESILLRSHLVRCGSCETFKLDAAAFTRTLRKASLETMSRPVIVSRRRSIAFQPLRVPGAAALAALTIASGGLFASLHGGLGSPPAEDRPRRRPRRSGRPPAPAAECGRGAGRAEGQARCAGRRGLADPAHHGLPEPLEAIVRTRTARESL